MDRQGGTKDNRRGDQIPWQDYTAGEETFFRKDLHAELPEIVDYADVSIHDVSPGLLGIVVQFVLNDTGAKKLEIDLRQDRSTYLTPTGTGYSYHNPRNQKIESSTRIRRQLREECVDWFCQFLPGFFSSDGMHRSMASAEFITLKKAIPFSDPPEPALNGFLDVLQLGHDFYLWDSSELPGVKLNLARESSGPPQTLVLAAREDEFFGGVDEDTWNRYGGRGRNAYANRLHEFGTTFVTWLVQAMVGQLESEYAEFRNRLTKIELDKPGRAAHQLKDYQRDLLELSRTAILMVDTLKDRISDNRWFGNNEYDFYRTRDVEKKESPLFQDIRKGISVAAARLMTVETELTRIVTNQASLIASISQEGTNRWLFRLTLVLVFLTVVIASLTAVLVWEDELRDIFERESNAYQMPTNSRTSELAISTQWENLGVNIHA